MDTITKGKLGYNLLEKELLKREWEIYTPITENTKRDCIIIKNDVLWKLQIKTIQYDKRDRRKFLPVRKIEHNYKGHTTHFYTSDEIDFFVGVDIDTEDIYLVPISFSSKYTSSIGINTLTKNGYKNNFNLLEPYNGNIISGEDDIGEGLTANTEGTE